MPIVRCSLLACVLALCAPMAATAASTTTLSGTVKGTGAKGLRVMALSTNGQAITAPLKSNGTFRLKVAAKNSAGLSLQLVAADGSYNGPVLLYAKGSKGSTRFAAIKAKTVKLGTIKLQKGYATLGKPLAAKAVLTKGSGVLKLSGGAPQGAGKLGLVKTGGAKASQSGGGSCGERAPEAGGGGDCDGDGVPNAVDVDDNGNGSLDAVDPQSARASARANPFFSIRPHFRNQLNVYGGANRASINAFLGASAEETGLNMTYYLDQQAIDQTEQRPFDNVWITCSSGQPWCAPGTATALVSGLSDVPAFDGGSNRFAQLPWNTFRGSRCTRSSCTPGSGSDSNSLAQVDTGRGPLPVWIASVRPSAADTFATVAPGDVLTLNARKADGSVISQPTTIAPYYVTSPAIASYGPVGGTQTTVGYPIDPNGPGTNQGTAVTLDASGKLQIRFWRPQRFALPGEDGDYYDIGGLRWAVGVESYNENGQFRPLSRPTACDVSDLVGLTPVAATNEFETVRMRDATSTDQRTDAADAQNRLLGFTVDVKACLQAAGAPTGSGVGTLLTILAKGEDMTGGANSTGMDMEVRLP